MVIERITLLIALFLSYSCQQTNKEQQSKASNMSLIKGSWSACLSDGLYAEIHFRNDDYAFHLEGDFLDYNVGKYIFCEGGMLSAVQEEEIFCDQEDGRLIEVEFSTPNEFIAIEDTEVTKYVRLSESPLMRFELGTRELEKTNYMKEFNSRKDTFNCQSNSKNNS